MFRAGDELECIDEKGAFCCLEQGKTYICTGIEPDFVNVDCCAEHQDGQCHWFSYRFRRKARKTDISIFRTMLTPANREKVDG